MSDPQKEIQNHILTFIQKEFQVTQPLDEKSNIQDILDSLDTVNLLFHLEDQYQIKIPDDDLSTRESFLIKNLSEYIHHKMTAK